MLLVVTTHPTPYYDDSYGVNTANAGPYGDALTKELYPAVEKQFRAIGASWARVVFGGSTGGWMTLAQQIFYPDYFGGAWGFCPDPIDLHAFRQRLRRQKRLLRRGPFPALSKTRRASSG
jgi:enterochelin esterase-like enzyme